MLDLIRDQDIRDLLQQARTIAVIGAKDKPGQPVDNVGQYLIQAGYRVVPVHPKRKNVWGLETWPSILDIPFPVDIIDVFRAPDYCPDHAREVLELNYTPLCFWMQLGIRCPEAGEILKNQPITVIQDKCLKIEHERLM